MSASSPVYSSPIIAALSALSPSSVRAVGQKKGNETAVMVARFLPLALLLLFSLALWAFYAAPILSVNVIIDKIESNLYQIYGDPLLEYLRPIIITIFIVTAAVNLVSVILLAAARNRKIKVFSFLALLVYLLFLIFGIILIVLIKKLELDVGACPILLVVFSSILMIVTLITLIIWAKYEPHYNNSVDGVYYLYENGTYNWSKFISIIECKGTWGDQGGRCGNFERRGNHIKFNYEPSSGQGFFYGTIFGDVLKLENTTGNKITYAKRGHQHSFENGLCACGCRIESKIFDTKTTI